jgi:hypothetical protein
MTSRYGWQALEEPIGALAGFEPPADQARLHGQAVELGQEEGNSDARIELPEAMRGLAAEGRGGLVSAEGPALPTESDAHRGYAKRMSTGLYT